VAGGTTVALSFELAPTDLLAAHIQVTANLPGADLYVDGVRAGQTPLVGTLTVAPGSHLVEVRRDGYTPARREITLGSGAAGSLSLELQEDPAATTPRGSLVLAVSEPEAEVSVDGVRRGVYRSPLSLPAGPHRITVMRAGFVPSERVMDVAAVGGTTNQVLLTPTPETRAAYVDHARAVRRWGWIAAVGGAALGIAGGALAAAQWGPVHDARAARDDVLATFQPGGPCDSSGGPDDGVCNARLDAANDDVDAHERWRAAGLIGAGIGAAALAVGATLLLAGDDPARYDLAGASEGRSRSRFAFRFGLTGTLPTMTVVGRF
jgi:hypothetical protein